MAFRDFFELFLSDHSSSSDTINAVFSPENPAISKTLFTPGIVEMYLTISCPTASVLSREAPSGNCI